MADSQQQSQQNQEPPAEPTPEEAKKQFWAEFHTELDTWFNKKRDELRSNSTSRAGGRTTLPSLIADAFFGKPKD
jgi:hypothetical protein